MTKPLVIVSSPKSSVDLHVAVVNAGAVPLIAPAEDVLWLARQLRASAVVLDAPADPRPDHQLFELAGLSRSTGMAVLVRRERFVEDAPCEAPRLVFVEAGDGPEHLAAVLDGLLSTSRKESDFDIEVDVDVTWILPEERATFRSAPFEESHRNRET